MRVDAAGGEQLSMKLQELSEFVSSGEVSSKVEEKFDAMITDLDELPEGYVETQLDKVLANIRMENEVAKKKSVKKKSRSHSHDRSRGEAEEGIGEQHGNGRKRKGDRPKKSSLGNILKQIYFGFLCITSTKVHTSWTIV